MRLRPPRLLLITLLLITDLAFLVMADASISSAVSTRQWADLVMSFMALMAAIGLTLAVLAERPNTSTRR
jgi:hypothetical protein